EKSAWRRRQPRLEKGSIVGLHSVMAVVLSWIEGRVWELQPLPRVGPLRKLEPTKTHEICGLSLLFFFLRLQHTADGLDCEIRLASLPVTGALCLDRQFRPRLRQFQRIRELTSFLQLGQLFLLRFRFLSVVARRTRAATAPPALSRCRQSASPTTFCPA